MSDTAVKMGKRRVKGEISMQSSKPNASGTGKKCAQSRLAAMGHTPATVAQFVELIVQLVNVPNEVITGGLCCGRFLGRCSREIIPHRCEAAAEGNQNQAANVFARGSSVVHEDHVERGWTWCVLNANAKYTMRTPHSKKKGRSSQPCYLGL